jgi:DNA-binding MarR family transcriptional regulator
MMEVGMSKNREELLRELEEENRKSTAESMFLLQAVAERSGMNLTDLQCITILTSTGPITAGRLAEEMGLTTGSVTGVIDRMERAGYVRREKDPDDARRVIVRPVSEKLESAGAGFFASQGRVLEELMSEYDDQDLTLFLDLMRKSNAITREETARIRVASRGGEGGEFSAPLGSAQSGRVVFANGASRLAIRAGSGMDDLYRARFEGPVPKVDVADGIVTFRYPRGFGGLFEWRNRSGGEVTLNAAVPWEVEVRGGAYKVEADLSGLKLISFVLTRGSSDVDLTLPEPSGTVPVRVSGGASKANIRRPAGVEAQLSVKGGASKLTFDEQNLAAVGGKLRLQSPGYDSVSDRYEIEVSGGASKVNVQ